MDENELDSSTLISLINKINSKQLIIIKFTATWCAPCKKIKPLCDHYIQKLPSNIIFFEIDVDETMDLYGKLKKYKMVNGIPALLAYTSNNKNSDMWYIPEFSQFGSDSNNVNNFFQNCINYVK